MTTKEEIKNIVEQNPQYKEKLFIRGFYFTNDQVNEKEYPFYNNWNKEAFGPYTLLVHNKQHYYVQKSDDGQKTLILVGHAYNPFTMEPDENKILKKLANADKSSFRNIFNELTGIFTLIIIKKNNLKFIGDPTCMQCVFYEKVNNHIHISSHTQLLGDILNLEFDPYINQLKNYKFFHLLGNSLPGDLSPYKEIQRLTPNHYAIYEKNSLLQIERFYYPHAVHKNLNEIAKLSAKIIHNNLILISQKWNKPAISLTGGCDSKTTLACANGLYEKFLYFSYISNEAEKVDAEAAHKICKKLDINHTIYNIPKENSKFKDLELTKKILFINSGSIITNNENDIRKRNYLSQIDDFDIEVKSWVSEIPRAYYSKRFNGRTNFGKYPSPRKCTTLYKFFLNNRALVKKTDEVFANYLSNFFKQVSQDAIEWQEQFFWEFRVASWNSNVITSEHKYSSDITIPYNNRNLLEIMLSTNLEDRINDNLHKKIRQVMNIMIDETNINVINLKHTHNRAKAENLYYTLHSHIPF